MAYNDAIASIESGGRYDKLGPFTKSGDRAYGRYQVMGANLPEWTKAALGQAMTPQQFLASPQAQDAVFNHRFGQYVQKYGPEGAARAWFAGEGGMNDLDRKDVLGTSVADYARKFNAAIGQGVPTDISAQRRSGPLAQLIPPKSDIPSPRVENSFTDFYGNTSNRASNELDMLHPLLLYGHNLAQKAMSQGSKTAPPPPQFFPQIAPNLPLFSQPQAQPGLAEMAPAAAPIAQQPGPAGQTPPASIWAMLGLPPTQAPSGLDWFNRQNTFGG